MATQVTRSLSEIELRIKAIDKQLKAASRETASLDRALKLDPKNLELSAAKAKSLSEQMNIAQQRVALLKQRQAEFKVSAESGGVPSEEYKKLTNQIIQAESQVKVLNQEIAKTKNAKLDKLQNSLSGVSRVAMALLASIVAIGVAFAKIGEEIDDATKRFSVSAATYQYWRNIFDKTTGDSSGYYSALVAATTLLGQVSKESSKAATSLATIGLTLDDLKGKSAAEALQIIILALQNIEDADERTAVATAILGNAGANLAMVSQLTADEIAALNAEMDKAGVITDEEAAAAGKLSDAFDNLKNQFNSVIVQLGMAMMPLFESLIEIISNLLPFLTSVATVVEALGAPGQVVLLIVIAIVAILPKLIAAIKAVNIALTAFGANPVSAKFLLIASAIALVIILLVELAKWLSEVFGRKWSLDMDTSLAESTLQGTNVAVASETGNVTNTTNNNITYYDHSTTSINPQTVVDLDEVIDQLHSKRIMIGK